MSKKIIAIDAGHGSNTAGKRTFDGYREHWINVVCANYFKEAVERCGFSAVRVGWDDVNAKDDEDVAILTRQKRVRSSGACACFSWHANHSGGKTWDNAAGVETFVHSVADKRGKSQKLAELVQAELIKGTHQKNRGVKTGNFGMCNAVYMKCDAAVLIEVGFMSNKEETALMKTNAFCREQAEDACRGLCKYYGVTYISPNVKDKKEAEADAKAETSKTSTPKYIVGNTYTLQTELKVRTGPGTAYRAKSYDELTTDGKKHDKDKDGALEKGTRVTCQEVRNVGEDIWTRCPSGWLAAYYNKNQYIK